MEAMALDEGLQMDQDHRQKSGRGELEQTVQSQISAKELEVKELREEIRAKERQIEAKERQIEAKELQIEAVELAISSETERRGALDATLQFLRQQITSLLQQITNLGQEKTSLRQEIMSLVQQLGNLQQERTSLRSLQAGTPKNDNTLSIRKHIVEQRVRLCNVDALQGLLKTELEVGVRFPVTLNMWNSLPPNRDKLFKLAGPDEECYKIVPLVNAIVDPPMPAPTADTEKSFHHFWDTVIEEPLKFFFDGPWLAERNESGEGSNSGTRPNKVVRFGFRFYALWRGEEIGPSSAGDPRNELISKLDWTYKHLPFLLAYYARATLVTFCALHVVEGPYGESKKMCNDLIRFNISKPEDRLGLVLVCITLAKLLKTMEDVCEEGDEESDMPYIRRNSGKIIRPFGGKVEKTYPDEACYKKVVAIYEATSDCPNVEELLHKRDSDQTIVVGRAVVAKPNNNDELKVCIRCLCEALQWLHGEGFMHRDIRWENVLRDRVNAKKWVLVDLDEAIKRDECVEPHPLDAISHAPEMTVGPHDTMVDIWGIGRLLLTSNVILDSKLSGLMERCLHQVPDQRPTAAECLKLLDM